MRVIGFSPEVALCTGSWPSLHLVSLPVGTAALLCGALAGHLP